MDFREVLPCRLDIEVNGFNGGLLTGIPSSYGHYVNLYGCKWPVGYDANICFEGENTLTVDFDTRVRSVKWLLQHSVSAVTVRLSTGSQSRVRLLRLRPVHQRRNGGVYH